MTTFKPGQRVKIFYKSDGGYGLGTVGTPTGLWKDFPLVIAPDEFPGSLWELDAFRVELVEEVEV